MNSDSISTSNTNEPVNYNISITFNEDSQNELSTKSLTDTFPNRHKYQSSLNLLSPTQRPLKLNTRNLLSINEVLASKPSLTTIPDLEQDEVIKHIRSNHEKRLSSFLLTLQPPEGIILSQECSPLNSPGPKNPDLSQPSFIDDQVLSDITDSSSEEEEDRDKGTRNQFQIQAIKSGNSQSKQNEENKSTKMRDYDSVSASSAFDDDDEEDFIKVPKSRFHPSSSNAPPKSLLKSDNENSTNEKRSFTFNVSKYFSQFKGIVGGIIRRKGWGGSEPIQEEEDEYIQQEEERPEAFVSVVPGLQETELDSIDIELSVKFQATRMNKSLNELIKTLTRYSTQSLVTFEDHLDHYSSSKNHHELLNSINELEQFDLDEITRHINKNRKRLSKLIPLFTERLRKKHKIWVSDLIVLDKITEGPYAETFRVFDIKKKEFFGLKVLRKSRGWTLSSFELQVLREIEIYVHMYNQNDQDLLQMYAFEHDIEKNEYSIVFELGYGTLRNFQRFMSKNQIENKYEVLGGIGQQLHHQVQKLKSMQIAHKDIKEENIIITKEGQLKLSDFSCAQKHDKIGYNTLSVCGTPFYMPPELRMQWEQKQATYNYDPFRSDIYSIGTMLTSLLMKNRVRPEDQMAEISTEHGAEVCDLIQYMLMQREIPVQMKKQSFRKIICEQSDNYESYFRKKILDGFMKTNRILDQPKLLRVGLFLNETEQHFMEKIKLSEELKNKGDIARSKLHLAILYKEQDRIPQCLSILKELRGKIPRQERILNYYRIKIKAELYFQQQRYEKSVQEYIKLKEFYEKYFSEKELLMGHALKGLGLAYKKQGRYEKAYKSLQKSAHIYIDQLGQEHLEVALVLEQVGLILEHKGKYLDALIHYQKAMKRLKILYGNTHPRIGQLYGRLGTVSLRQKHYDEALNHHRKALEIHQACSGALSADVAGMFGHIATVYRHQNQYNESLSNYFKAMEIYLKHDNDYQREISIMCEHVANLHEKIEKYSDALPYYLKSLEIKRELSKDINPDVAASFCQVGSVYLKMRKFKDALQNYWNALEIEKRLNGDVHPKVGRVLYRIATIYREMRDYSGATKNFISVIDIFAINYEECRNELAKAFSHLGKLYELQSQKDDAISNYCESAELFKKSKGESSIEFAVCHSRLGHIYDRNDSIEYAIKSYKIALPIYQKVYGEQNEKTIRIHERLGRLLSTQGNRIEAYKNYSSGIEARLDPIFSGKQQLKVKKFISVDV